MLWTKSAGNSTQMRDNWLMSFSFPSYAVLARRSLTLIVLATTLGGEVASAAAPANEGADLIGKAAPEWTASDWIGSPPLTLAGLRGKVVLVRWFTDTDCPYCTATAPSLNQLHRDFGKRGLVVIGMYHHKRPEPLKMPAVRGWASDYGFQFPVAVDRDWRTLKRWWLDGAKREFTSVSFLIDRNGVIQHIHPGGTLAPGGADFAVLRARITELTKAGD
jgi:peroxiredoxin